MSEILFDDNADKIEKPNADDKRTDPAQNHPGRAVGNRHDINDVIVHENDDRHQKRGDSKQHQKKVSDGMLCLKFIV